MSAKGIVKFFIAWFLIALSIAVGVMLLNGIAKIIGEGAVFFALVSLAVTAWVWDDL